MGREFNSKIMSNYDRWVKLHQGATTGTGFCVYNVLGWLLQMWHNGVLVDTLDYQASGPGSFPTRGRYDLLSSVDMVNLSSRWVDGGSLE